MAGLINKEVDLVLNKFAIAKNDEDLKVFEDGCVQFTKDGVLYYITKEGDLYKADTFVDNNELDNIEAFIKTFTASKLDDLIEAAQSIE